MWVAQYVMSVCVVYVLWCAQVWTVPYVITWVCVMDELVFICVATCVICACIMCCDMHVCHAYMYVLQCLFFMFLCYVCTCMLCCEPIPSIWCACVYIVQVCALHLLRVCYKCILWEVYVYMCKCAVCIMHVMWSSRMCCVYGASVGKFMACVCV